MTTANHDQAEYWNGQESSHWVTRQEQHDRMLSPFTALILDAASLSPGDHVLDVGCGCGATTLAAARAVEPGMAVGADLSAPMLGRARQSAELAGVTNVSFEQADAQVHHFRQAFDAIISRFGIMFFNDPVAAFANLRGAARPGGRLAFVCWQSLVANEWLLVPAAALAEHLPVPDTDEPGAPGMFSLAEPDRIRRVLGEAGWRDVSVTSQHASILVGGGTIDDAIALLRAGSLGRRILEPADPVVQARALRSMREALARHEDAEGVHLDAAIWLVRARA